MGKTRRCEFPSAEELLPLNCSRQFRKYGIKAYQRPPSKQFTVIILLLLVAPSWNLWHFVMQSVYEVLISLWCDKMNFICSIPRHIFYTRNINGPHKLGVEVVTYSISCVLRCLPFLCGQLHRHISSSPKRNKFIYLIKQTIFYKYQ